MRARKLAFALLVLCAVVACASTGVIPMDQDSYMIGKKDGSPGVGVSLSNKAAVYREAGSFCREKGLEVKTLHETVTPARPGRLGSTELQFRCIPPGGPGQALVKDPDTVIQVAVPTSSDAYTELLKLNDLRRTGVITEQEFQAQKSKLLNAR